METSGFSSRVVMAPPAAGRSDFLASARLLFASWNKFVKRILLLV
jgi:hypothetical protein